jgi:hypothetical protein
MNYLPRLLLFCLLLPFTELYAQTDATRIVTEAYEDVLGRKPDEEGLRHFRSNVIEKDWTAEDVRNALRKSDEYANRVITMAFQDILGRKPDEGALKNYRHKIKEKGWTEKQVRNELRRSDEYKQKNR